MVCIIERAPDIAIYCVLLVWFGFFVRSAHNLGKYYERMLMKSLRKMCEGQSNCHIEYSPKCTQYISWNYGKLEHIFIYLTLRL